MEFERQYKYKSPKQIEEEEAEDIAERLEEETAWPGQREEFSDKLFR